MTIKKGIILAAGKATRLHPTSLAFGKQLMAVYDKPMIYYPLATLMAGGIRDILIIVTPRDKPLFEAMLGDGSKYGVNISYKEQFKQDGIAGAFLIGEEFIGDDEVCLILGDNFFHGPHFNEIFSNALKTVQGATIFCHHVEEPSAYGVAVMNDAGRVSHLVEKPAQLISNWAVTGLYLYDNQACAIAKTLMPSRRGELEVTDLNIRYLEQGKLSAVKLDQSYRWFDLGTHASIHEASAFIQENEKQYGHKIGCLSEIAYHEGFISRAQMLENASGMGNPAYAKYLRDACEYQPAMANTAA